MVVCSRYTISFHFILCHSIFFCKLFLHRAGGKTALGLSTLVVGVVSVHITSSANTNAFFVYLFVALFFFHFFSFCISFVFSLSRNKCTILFLLRQQIKLNAAKHFIDTHTQRQQADCIKQTHIRAIRKTEIIRTNFPFINCK